MPLVDDTMDESTPWLIEELKRRFHSLDNGFILDEINQQPTWCLTAVSYTHLTLPTILLV